MIRIAIPAFSLLAILSMAAPCSSKPTACAEDAPHHRALLELFESQG